MACKYSLIIPVYQVREYIEQCLESIFCQIPEDVQVVLVDDGSTDGSGEICDEYAKKYSQIEVIHQENKGVAAARNAGLDAAKGEYLLWVDPDDWVEEGWYCRLDGIISAQKPDILVFDYSERENDVRRECMYGRAPGYVDREQFLDDVVKDIRINSSLWNKVIRKELFDGIVFDGTLRCLEDYALIHLLIMKAERIYYLRESLYQYRIRKTSLVRTLNLEISRRSYLVALGRKKQIEQTGRECSILGCVKQARAFCRNYYVAGCPQDYRQTFVQCQRFILRGMPEIIFDKDLGIKDKVKSLMVTSSLIGRIYAKNMMKR